MPQKICSTPPEFTVENLIVLHRKYMKQGLGSEDLKNVVWPSKKTIQPVFYVISIIVLLVSLLYYYKYNLLNVVWGLRCIVPNNFFVWEGTRPISDCSFCSNVTEPIVLHNITREEFAPYAYSSTPIIVRQAFLHWPAKKKFSWKFFKDLYTRIEGSLRSVDEECQLLHFKSDFTSIQDIFAMTEARVRNLRGEKSWYVGWGNCHPTILQEMRKYYPKPHFLPEDAEISYKDYVFMGYDDGATMHLDFINRLMWQAQLQGSKIWNLLPPPECQEICKPVTFNVQPGDGVLVDTRIWYHATTIPNGEFSLSVQSEYG